MINNNKSGDLNYVFGENVYIYIYILNYKFLFCYLVITLYYLKSQRKYNL